MGVSFFERMNGRLVDAAGVGHLVDFDVKAESTRIGAALRTGQTRLSGVVRILPWAEDAPVSGTLTVSRRRRTVEYVLDFVGESGAALRLLGRKDFDWRHPLASMTLMDTRLVRRESGADELATGTMRFDNNDMLAFLASFSPTSSAPRLDLARPAPPGLPSAETLPSGDLATAVALAEALVEPGVAVPPVDSRTADRLRGLFPHLPAHVRTAYLAGIRSLDAAARLRTKRSFADLDVPARRQVLEDVDRLGGDPLVVGLWIPIALAHFGRDDYLAAVGIVPPEPPAPEKPPRYMANVHVPDTLEALSEVPCDVVVVGSGAGGGPVAATLAEQGFAVAVIEEGDYNGRAEFSGALDDRMFRLWRHRGMNLALGNGVVSIPTGRTVGGTTAINSGTCLRTPDGVLKSWRDRGFPADFDERNFRPWLDRVSEELQVAEAPGAWLGRIGSIVARGADALASDGHAVEHGPLPRNAPGCDGQGSCAFGCPTDARRSSNVSWIPRALRAGANVFPGMRVSRILYRGSRAVGVEAVGRDRLGAPRTLRIRARAVVVAAGTLGSPALLRENNVRLPRLGKGLSIHPAVGALAMFDESLGKPWRAIPQSYEVSGLVDPRIRFEGSTSPPQFAAPLLPLRGAELTRWMDRWDHVGHYGFMVCDGNSGSVARGPGGAPIVRYDLTPDVVDLLTRGTAMLAELLLRGGAREVAAGIQGIPPITSVGGARSLTHQRINPRRFRVIGFHPLGTCAMGATPEDGVVDFDNRVFGTTGLYVVDGSTVPTSLGVNPQMTIMAMALRAAEHIGASL